MLLYQPPYGYCYNSDSIFLYAFARRFRPRGALLDLGCGVGVIALLLARDFPVRVSLVDKQPHMIAYARHNFAIHGLEPKVYLGDFLEWECTDRFDFVVSNPPFYDPGVSQSADPILNAARYAQHLPLEEMVAKVSRILMPRGRFVFCYDAKQSDRVLESLRRHRLTPEEIRFVHPKLDREAKIVLVSARAGSRSLCRILPPLVVFGADGEYGPEAAEAFRLADTHSIKAERADCIPSVTVKSQERMDDGQRT
ncbi:tRNA1(Val) (adenine(37)-N6)-methyltransferase [Nitratifractor sp.]